MKIESGAEVPARSGRIGRAGRTSTHFAPANLLPAVALLAAAVVVAALSGRAVGASATNLPTLVVATSLLVLAGIRWGLLAGSALVVTLSLPLLGDGWLEIHGTTIGLFTLLLLVFAGSVAIRASLADAKRVGRSSLPALLLVYAVVVAVSLLAAERTSVTGGLAKTYLARELLFPIVLAVALVALGPAARETIGRLVLALIFCGVIGSLLSVVQIAKLEGYFAPPAQSASVAQFIGTRAIGLAEAPGTWGSFLLLPFCFCLVGFLHRPSRWNGGLLLWLTAGLVLSGLRAAWLALLVATIAAVAICPRPPRRLLATTLLVVAGAALPFALGNFRIFLKGGGADTIQLIRHGGGTAAAPAYAASVQIENQSVSIGKGRLGNDESSRYRQVLSRAEFDLGRHHPLTGVGLGNIGPALTVLQPRYVVDHPEVGLIPGVVIDKQNTYTGLFAELGAPGILLFLAIGVAALRSLYRTRRMLRDPLVDGTLVALIATAVVAGFWDSDRQPFLWWLIGIAIALETLARRGAAQRAASGG